MGRAAHYFSHCVGRDLAERGEARQAIRRPENRGQNLIENLTFRAPGFFRFVREQLLDQFARPPRQWRPSSDRLLFFHACP